PLLVAPPSSAPPTSNGAVARQTLRGTLRGGEEVELERSMVRVMTADSRRVQPIIDDLRRRGAVIRALRPVRPSLEDLFMQAVTDPVTGEVLKPGAPQGRGRTPGGRA